ncbi:MAG: DUF2272 domain-containing protein, partial [Rickettsiales bacterium]|nr:DUF2272 domain-containing protein [Rickettsiales bacterium]
LATCAKAQYSAPYLKQPFTPFSREEAVAVAMREWRMWGEVTHDDLPSDEPVAEEAKQERKPGYWQRVGDYFWEGVPDSDDMVLGTGRHTREGAVFAPEKDANFAWSGAFISYVMKQAGADRRFPYASNHVVYINAAREVSLSQRKDAAISAEDPALYAPQVGDIICAARGKTRQVFADLPSQHRFYAHCDLVVAKEDGVLSVIGGNVRDSVSMKHVPVTQDGLLFENGAPLDNRYRWMVVLRVLYDQ